MIHDITVCVPTIPPRRDFLRRALHSIACQTLPPATVIVEYDHGHLGPAITRNRALGKVDTEWVAWLDDDDEMRPQHLAALHRHAVKSGADLVYPWFDVVSSRPGQSGFDPLGAEGRPFDPVRLREANYIPVTVLARTEVVRAAGGFRNRAEPPRTTCEDWGCWLAMLDAGAKIEHLPIRSWIWNWHPQNTSGRNDVW